MTSQSSKSSSKATKTIAEFVEENSQMPRSPLTVARYGIAAAAACYPIVVLAYVAVFGGFRYGLPASPSEVVLMLCSLLIICVVGATYGIVMSLPAYLLLQVFGWVSGGVISARGASGVYGGLTGFLASTGGGLSFILTTYSSLDDPYLWIFLAFYPLLAIVMGYVGAIWAGYRYRNHGFPFFEPLFSVEQQFTIAFLMKLTTIVAVLIVVCKAAGEPGLYVGTAWGAYCVVQMLLLLCDHCLRYRVGWR